MSEELERGPTSVIAVWVKLKRPVNAGSTIRVRTKTPALCVTDSAGNTYVRVAEQQWRAHNCLPGETVITITNSAGDVGKITVQEWTAGKRVKKWLQTHSVLVSEAWKQHIKSLISAPGATKEGE